MKCTFCKLRIPRIMIGDKIYHRYRLEMDDPDDPLGTITETVTAPCCGPLVPDRAKYGRYILVALILVAIVKFVADYVYGR